MKQKTIPNNQKKLLKRIGSIIKTYRELGYINQSEIKCIHYNTLSALEQGKANITLLNLLAICEELEVPLDLLFEDYED